MSGEPKTPTLEELVREYFAAKRNFEYTRYKTQDGYRQEQQRYERAKRNLGRRVGLAQGDMEDIG